MAYTLHLQSLADRQPRPRHHAHVTTDRELGREPAESQGSAQASDNARPSVGRFCFWPSAGIARGINALQAETKGFQPELLSPNGYRTATRNERRADGAVFLTPKNTTPRRKNPSGARGYNWCPEAESNHRHEDFQSLWIGGEVVRAVPLIR